MPYGIGKKVLSSFLIFVSVSFPFGLSVVAGESWTPLDTDFQKFMTGKKKYTECNQRLFDLAVLCFYPVHCAGC